ncbi:MULTISPECIES: EamA family transporter [unclassified Holdemanella]|uniref:EamA family transporter n=1 Tax=unclassified Holdemanella TaxID=2633909 RepID=UPI001D0AC4DE|nr:MULTISPECIES: hypothetical protein [unclassified Holdemanella]MCB8641267.1 hypothetical protein [Holdemanella sp. DFI.5.55]MCG5650126.1 hypothetical protein [Holdemanella sp. DFI.5.21]
MWILYATGSAFFAGITSILEKCGISKTNSDVATAIRTIVVLVFSWILVLLTRTISGITVISGKTLLFLVLSGITTGASYVISRLYKLGMSIRWFRLINPVQS